MYITVKGPETKKVYRAYRNSEKIGADEQVAAEWQAGFAALAFAAVSPEVKKYKAVSLLDDMFTGETPYTISFSEDKKEDTAMKNAIRKAIGLKLRKNPVYYFMHRGEWECVPISFIKIVEEYQSFLVLGVYTADGRYVRVHDSFLAFMQEDGFVEKYKESSKGVPEE